MLFNGYLGGKHIKDMHDETPKLEDTDISYTKNGLLGRVDFQGQIEIASPDIDELQILLHIAKDLPYKGSCEIKEHGSFDGYYYTD